MNDDDVGVGSSMATTSSTTTASRRSVRIAKRAARAPTEDARADADDEYWEKRKERARVLRNRKPKPRRKRVRTRPFPELEALARRGERDLMTPEEQVFYDWCRAPRPRYDDVDAADYLGIPYEMRRPSAVPRIHYDPVNVDDSDPVREALDRFRSAALEMRRESEALRIRYDDPDPVNVDHSDPVTGFLDGFRSAALSRLTREPERRGLSADDLEKYAPTKNAGFPCGKACAVCLEEPARESSVRELPCSHVYHRACIDRWFDLSNCCPTCRKPVRPDEHTPVIPTRDQIRPDLDSWGAYVRLVSRINAPLTTP